MSGYVAASPSSARKDYLGAASDVLLRVEDDATGSLLIVGDPGGGQRDLLRRLERAAGAAERQVIPAWAPPSQPPLMFALALGELLGAEDPGTSDPIDWARALRRSLRAPESVDGSHGPPVVLLYDVQHLAPQDAAIVEHLLCAPSPALVVATAASRLPGGVPWGDFTAFREQARVSDHCDVIDLGPLRLDDADGLVEERVGPGAAARRFVRELHHRTGGAVDDMSDWLDVLDQCASSVRVEDPVWKPLD